MTETVEIDAGSEAAIDLLSRRLRAATPTMSSVSPQRPDPARGTFRGTFRTSFDEAAARTGMLMSHVAVLFVSRQR